MLERLAFETLASVIIRAIQLIIMLIALMMTVARNSKAKHSNMDLSVKKTNSNHGYRPRVQSSCKSICIRQYLENKDGRFCLADFEWYLWASNAALVNNIFLKITVL